MDPEFGTFEGLVAHRLFHQEPWSCDLMTWDNLSLDRIGLKERGNGSSEGYPRKPIDNDKSTGTVADLLS